MRMKQTYITCSTVTAINRCQHVMHNHSYSICSLVPRVLFVQSLEAREERDGTGHEEERP